jgi:hypothetical protein
MSGDRTWGFAQINALPAAFGIWADHLASYVSQPPGADM